MFVDVLDALFRDFDQFIFDLRHNHIENTDRNAAHSRIVESHFLDLIEDSSCLRNTADVNAPLNNDSKFLLPYSEITFEGYLARIIIAALNKAEILRNNAVEQKTSERRLNDAAIEFAIILDFTEHTDLLTERDHSFTICHFGFLNT